MKRVSNLNGKSGVFEITPDDARELLENPGAKNRPLKMNAVARYARRMKAGLWALTGEPVILDEQGRLLDGEHRLRACIEADKPFLSVIVMGEFRFASMGQGTVRGGGDAIALGVPSSSNHIAMSAMAGLVIRHDRAAQREVSPYSNAHKAADNWFDVDNAERVTWFRKNSRAEELYSKAKSVAGKARLLPLSPTAAAWLLAERATSEAEAADFFENLVSGAGLGKDDVRLHMRQALSNRMRAGEPRPGGVEMLHWCAKAWAVRKDSSRRQFVVKKSEKFPFIR